MEEEKRNVKNILERVDQLHSWLQVSTKEKKRQRKFSCGGDGRIVVCLKLYSYFIACKILLEYN